MTKLTDNTIRDHLVALTRDLMLVPTTHSRPAEIKRGFQLIRNHLEILKHVHIEEYEDKGFPSLVVLPTGVKKPKILVCAHIDVVDYPDPSAFKSKIEKGRIVGPGAGDMKGAMAIGLEIFRNMQTEHPGISIGLALTSDEELGGSSGMGYLVGKKNLRCDVALVPDGGSLNHITTHEKGILHLKVKSKGHFSHASRPWEGNNALVNLIKNLHAIEDLFNGYKTKGSNWYATCSPTMINTTNDAFNRIPDYAEAVLDIRFIQPDTSEDILKKIKNVTDKDFKAEVLIKAEPSELKPDPMYLEINKEITGKHVTEVRDHGGSDARFLAEKGIPVIINRPLVGHLHSEEEWIDINSMVTLYRIYERYFEKKLLDSR